MKKGNCFENAYKAIMDIESCGHNLHLIDGWKVAHGIVKGTAGVVLGQRYSHAWIETDDLVYNAETGNLFLRDLFYRFGSIKEVFRYTKAEVLEMILEHEHYGPWENRFNEDDLMG